MKNRVKCTQCGEVLESMHRHDFVSCECENGTFVDGGKDYRRIGGKEFNKILVWVDEYEMFLTVTAWENLSLKRGIEK